MSVDKRWRLVCYDIRDPARWRRVYKIVRGHGHRVQYSVFRCRLDRGQLEKLRWELAQVMATEDALLIIDLCPTCAANVISRNHVDGWEETIPPFRVIGGASQSAAQAPVDVAKDETPDGAEREEKLEDPAD